MRPFALFTCASAQAVRHFFGLGGGIVAQARHNACPKEARMNEIKRPDPNEILKKVRKNLGNQAEEVVPWFIGNMPDYYFRTHTLEEIVRHLSGVISGQVLSQGQTLTLRSPCETRITYISPGGPKVLSTLLEKHVNASIDNARFYTTLDGSLRLDTLLLSPQPRPRGRHPAFVKACQRMREHKHTPPLWPQDWTSDQEKSFRDFLSGASDDYVAKFEADRAARHFRLSKAVEEMEETIVDLETPAGWKESRISIAMSDPPRRGLLLQIIKVLQREDMQVHRGYADAFELDKGKTPGNIGIMSFYVCCPNGKPLAADSELWQRLRGELRLTKWLFSRHNLERFAEEQGWPLRRVMLLLAGAEFAHQFLIKDNLWAYTADNINRALLAHPEETGAVMEYFETRLSPHWSSNGQARLAAEELEKPLRKRLAEVEDEVARNTLECILRFFRYTLRTNYYLEAPHGLCFRLDPAFLAEQPGFEQQERPYGVYFYHGPYAQGFHVRYREMARGGLRMVRTRSQEQFELESNRLFDEVTKLAYAQQIKNKDIPEGGAKGVLLLGPDADMDRSVKGMVDAMLDCFLPGENGHTLPLVRDYLGKEEIIYLGPDEHIAPEHVTWMVERAARRGYAWPATLMSSKPGAGINHKQYGVTSLGVIVFAEAILQHLGIDPDSEPFSVTFTGGPRGDVAGNAVKLLVSRYGANARILTMADGHGAAFDPEGLDHEELLRLVREERPISDFAKEKISAGGFVITAETPEDAKRRNTLHNSVYADLFIPSGGRPETINDRNWPDFLDEDGRPAARAIIEGANIFISSLAREKLQEAGCLIVHGSSANKTGVICSSYEILAGLVMSEKEFLAMKKRYVAEVLEILRKRAADEARLMLQEYKRLNGMKPLTTITMELSQEIIKVSDALNSALCQESPNIAEDPQLRELYLGYCPKTLVRHYGEPLLHKVPVRHQYALLAAHAAAHIVYSEGVGWLERVTQKREAKDVMRAYLEQEQRLAELLTRLRRSRIEGREDLERILRSTGRKFLTNEALGLG